MAKDLTADQQNRQNQERAGIMLYELIQQALTLSGRSGKVKNISLRIPIHGDRLGTPLKTIEME